MKLKLRSNNNILVWMFTYLDHKLDQIESQCVFGWFELHLYVSAILYSYLNIFFVYHVNTID
jgi:hypothetical protein